MNNWIPLVDSSLSSNFWPVSCSKKLLVVRIVVRIMVRIGVGGVVRIVVRTQRIVVRIVVRTQPAAACSSCPPAPVQLSSSLSTPASAAPATADPCRILSRAGTIHQFLNAKFIVINTKFIILNTKFIIFNAEFTPGLTAG